MSEQSNQTPDFFEDFFDEVDTESKNQETSNFLNLVEEPEKPISTPFPAEVISEETNITIEQLSVEPAVESDVTETAEPKEEPVPLKSDATEEDPFANALRQATQTSEERMLEELVNAAAKFSYSGAKVDIADKDITFEGLRKQYEDDYPEFAETKKVTWAVSYGKGYKTISNPNTQKVYEIKTEIEKSKSFLDGIKNAKVDKDKKPECLVTPRITAQSKGEAVLPPHKGVYRSIEEALQNPKPIMLIPARDNQVYEIRKNEIGTFITPAASPPELSPIKACFLPDLPLVPLSTLVLILSFFKDFAMENLEVMVQLLFDTERQKYKVHIPKQTVSGAHINIDLLNDNLGNCIHVMDIHSHHQMEAKFSKVDDGDEKATRLYAVVGRMDKLLPDITLRISNGGKYLEISPQVMFESYHELFPAPAEWKENVTKDSIHQKRYWPKGGFKREVC